MFSGIATNTNFFVLWFDRIGNNLITTLLGIFPHEIVKKRAFFTLGLGPKKCSRKITECGDQIIRKNH
jgi:hypothetical protein